VHTALRRFATARTSRRDGVPAAFAAAVTGAAIAAAAGWLDAGSARGSLRDAVDAAVAPVAAAFDPLLPPPASHTENSPSTGGMPLRQADTPFPGLSEPKTPVERTERRPGDGEENR
jgi:hypothetical protein